MAGLEAALQAAGSIADFFQGRKRAKAARRAFETGIGEASSILSRLATETAPEIEAPIQQARATRLERIRNLAAQQAAARSRLGIPETSPLAQAQQRALAKSNIEGLDRMLATLFGSRQAIARDALSSLAQLGASAGAQRASLEFGSGQDVGKILRGIVPLVSLFRRKKSVPQQSAQDIIDRITVGQ